MTDLDKALNILHDLVTKAVRQAGPGTRDLDVDLDELYDCYWRARVQLYLLRGEI